MSHFLESERLYLRAVEETDLTEKYHAWLNDPDVNRFMETWHFPHTKENIHNYINLHADDRNDPFFAICLKNTFVKDSVHIGNIKLGPINWIHRYADISVFIGEKELWGKGYATEAIKLVTHYAFKKLGLHKVKAGIYENNRGSLHAFLRAGFRIEASLPDHVFINGEWSNIYLLGKINA